MTNREFFAQQAQHELGAFIRVFEALPESELAYRPHPSSRSAGELVGHLIGEVKGLAELTKSGEIHYQNAAPFASLPEGIELYRQAHETLVAQAESLSDEVWEEGIGKLIFSPERIIEMPTFRLAWLLFHDSIHHRGQLSVYLRPMGAKVPAIYGSSGDG